MTRKTITLQRTRMYYIHTIRQAGLKNFRWAYLGVFAACNLGELIQGAFIYQIYSEVQYSPCFKNGYDFVCIKYIACSGNSLDASLSGKAATRLVYTCNVLMPRASVLSCLVQQTRLWGGEGGREREERISWWARSVQCRQETGSRKFTNTHVQHNISPL